MTPQRSYVPLEDALHWRIPGLDGTSKRALEAAAVSGTLIDQQHLNDIRTVLRWLDLRAASPEDAAAVGRLRNLLEEGA